MPKGNIRLHDKLTSGGDVISISSTSIIDGINIALIGDIVFSRITISRTGVKNVYLAVIRK